MTTMPPIYPQQPPPRPERNATLTVCVVILTIVIAGPVLCCLGSLILGAFL